MRQLAFLIFIFFAACSKKESPNENQTGLATFIFSPGGVQTQISYFSFEENRQIIENKSTLYQIRESVNVGDQIKLGMQTFGKPVGNFSIRLNINGNQVKEVNLNTSDSGNEKTLYLNHTVSAKDLN